jgi:hypothetical protein
LKTNRQLIGGEGIIGLNRGWEEAVSLETVRSRLDWGEWNDERAGHGRALNYFFI